MNHDLAALQTHAPELVPYFRSAAAGVLSLPRCDRCGRRQWPPRPLCRHCGAAGLSWTAVPPRGRVFSWTTVHHGRPDGRPLPYTVVIAALGLPETVRLVGGLCTPDDGSRSLDGEPVTATFSTAGQPPGLPALVWHRGGPTTSCPGCGQDTTTHDGR